MNPRPFENTSSPESDLAELQLLHLADSALPIGSLSHSFGLESLVSEGILDVPALPDFLRGYLEEAGTLEAVFCRESHRLASKGPAKFSTDLWCRLNALLSALKPARESRAASASLGRNLLAAVLPLGDFPLGWEALAAARRPVPQGSSIHYSPAFGLVSSMLGIREDRAVLACVHQATASLVSACQRLLPLGQSAATGMLWNLKPLMVEVARRSASQGIDDVCCFMPLLDWGAMEHPALSTRLFVS